MADKTLTKEIETTLSLNERYRWLMYEDGANHRGFNVNLDDNGAVTKAHRWYSAGVEAAYLAVKDRTDVPDDVKHGLASYAGLVHGSQR